MVDDILLLINVSMTLISYVTCIMDTGAINFPWDVRHASCVITCSSHACNVPDTGTHAGVRYLRLLCLSRQFVVNVIVSHF